MAKNNKASKKHKGKYTLKEVYKRLLTEAIITPTEFLERIVNIVDSKSSVSGKYGLIIKKILGKTKETKLLTLKGKENKKARRAAELEIIKSLQDIKGIDGNPIDLKRMRPLYDSLAKFLENSADVNIDDCLKSADYYMREFYRSADQEDIELIRKGKFDFATVFKRTNFYQSIDEYKSRLSGMQRSLNPNEYADVYESPDSKILIVYPHTSGAFNRHINHNNAGYNPITWCTQSESTWFKYNSRQYVMIMTVDSGNHEERLISLKVSKKDGIIDKQGTCDANNQHMGDRLDHLLSQELIESVKLAAQSLYQKEKAREIEISEKRQKSRDRNQEVIKGLIELNRYSDIIDILNYAVVEYSEDYRDDIDIVAEYTFENLVNILSSEARANTQKKDNIVNAYIDFTASAYTDNNIDLSIYSYLQFFDGVDLTNELLFKRLIEKSLDRRSHEKYFMTLLDVIRVENAYTKSVNIEDYASFFGDPKEVLETCLLNALNTNNILFFKTIIKHSLEVEYIKKNIMTENFNGVLKTQGFSRLIDVRKENIINIENEDKEELYLQETIFQEQNKSIVSQILQEKQIDIESVDLSNVYNLIKIFNKTRDEKHLTKENINLNLISKNIDSDAIEKITSDLSYYNSISDILNQDDFDTTIFKLFISARDSQSLINYNERSFSVFDYIINHRSESELYNSISTHNPEQILDLIEVFMQNFRKSKEEISKKLANVILKGLKILIPSILRNQRITERIDSHEENFKHIIEIADANKDFLNLIFSIIEFLPMSDRPQSYSERLAVDFFNIEKMRKESIKLLKSQDIDEILKNYYYTRLGYYLVKNNKIVDQGILEKVFKSFLKVLSSLKYLGHSPSFYPDYLDIIMSYFKDKQTLSDFIGNNFIATKNNTDFLFQIIEEFNKLKAAFDKEKLGNIMCGNSFKSLDKNTRLSFYENLITISSDGHANHLDLIDDIDKVQSILAYNLKGISKSSGGLKRETTNFVDDLEDIVNFISRLKSASRKRLAQAIPQAKTVKRLWQQQPHDLDDYFESLLKQYLKLIIR